jgi:chromosomal replication initiation ATPase DnaA
MCGLAVGGRDHSTAIHSIRIVDKLVAGQPELAEFLTAVARGDEMALRRMRAVG